ELPSIPNNWSWMRFDQVADIASKLKSPLDYPNTIHLAPNHIESWTGKASGYQTILEDGVTSAKHEFYTGQIIYSKIRPYLCKVTIATFDGMCSADMYPINSKIDTHFLFRWMLTNTFTDWASNAESRTVLPKINQKDLSEIPVPTPPLPEQHEIVRRVEQLFAYADTIEKQVNNALARVNNLTQSILAKAFRGELTAQWRAENPDLISGENSAAALLEKIKAERAASGGKKASRKKS
ncbi:TPA: restriction endonuclease subunit S, partial [Escherichia coli]